MTRAEIEKRIKDTEIAQKMNACDEHWRDEEIEFDRKCTEEIKYYKTLLDGGKYDDAGTN